MEVGKLFELEAYKQRNLSILPGQDLEIHVVGMR